jgi:hypothetical protein
MSINRRNQPFSHLIPKRATALLYKWHGDLPQLPGPIESERLLGVN